MDRFKILILGLFITTFFLADVSLALDKMWTVDTYTGTQDNQGSLVEACIATYINRVNGQMACVSYGQVYVAGVITYQIVNNCDGETKEYQVFRNGWSNYVVTEGDFEVCCPDGQEWVEVLQSCQSVCSNGYERLGTGDCVPECGEGEHRAADNSCVPDNPCPEAEAACNASCESQGLKPSFSCIQIDGQYSTACQCIYDPDYVPSDELPPEADPVPPFEPMEIPDPDTETPQESEPGDNTEKGQPYEDSEGDGEDLPSESPNGEPVEEEQSKWLKPIKENLDKLIAQAGENNKANQTITGNQVVIAGKLSNIDSGISQITKNQVVLSSQGLSIISGVNETNRGLGVLSAQLSDINNTLKDGLDLDLPTSVIAQGNQPSLGPDNEYDSSVDEMEPDGFFELLIDYVSSNMPVVNYITGSGLDISGANPVMQFSFYGETIETDISEYEDILDKAGLVLLFISGLVAFRIVIRK